MSTSVSASFVKNRAKLFDGRQGTNGHVNGTAQVQKPFHLTMSNEDSKYLESRVSSKTSQLSYVHLSCTVNGYSGITRYDSSFRKDIRSRENSRDRLPLLLNSRSRDSSPHPSDRSTNRYSIGIYQPESPLGSPCVKLAQTRSKSVDRGYLNSARTSETRMTFLNGDSKPPLPIPGPCAPIQTTERGRLRTKTAPLPVHSSALSTHESMANGYGRIQRNSSGEDTVDRALEYPSSSNKSFVQQRIERLYGPGALARGFFKAKSTDKPVVKKNEKSPVKTAQVQVQENSSEEPALPVLRHLNPEFRQQLQIKSSRSNSIDQSEEQPNLGNHAEVNGHIVSEPIAQENAKSASKAGDAFLKTLALETARVEVLIAQGDIALQDQRVLESEELIGKVKAAQGKARLLIGHKFQQFAGLCQKNLTQSESEPFPTTCDDLAGFWDLVSIQVSHIRALFEELESLKAAGWVLASPQQVIIPRKRTIGTKQKNNNITKSAKAEEAAKAREEMRKKIMEEKRKLMKARKADANQEADSGEVEIFSNGKDV